MMKATENNSHLLLTYSTLFVRYNVFVFRANVKALNAFCVFNAALTKNLHSGLSGNKQFCDLQNVLTHKVIQNCYSCHSSPLTGNTWFTNYCSGDKSPCC